MLGPALTYSLFSSSQPGPIEVRVQLIQWSTYVVKTVVGPITGSSQALSDKDGRLERPCPNPTVGATIERSVEATFSEA